MHNAYFIASFFLVGCVFIGLVRLLLLPGRTEKLLALQLLGTTSVAVAILLAQALDNNGLTDLGLLIALLTSIVAIAYIRFIGLESSSTRESQ